MTIRDPETLPWWARTPGLHWSRLDPIGNRRIPKDEITLSVEPRFVEPDPDVIDLDSPVQVNLDEREQERTK